MPRKGYASITIPDDVYFFFKKEWEKHKSELRRKGVRSFSGYVSYKLNQLLEQEEEQLKAR